MVPVTSKKKLGAVLATLLIAVPFAAYALSAGDIGRLNSATSVASTDTLPIYQGGVLRKATPNQLVQGTTGQFLGGNGTAALPTYSFTADPDTGAYRNAANTYGIAAGGVVSSVFNTVASGVNYLTFTPSATTAAPVIGAAGTATNLDIQLDPKGTGVVEFGYAQTSAGTPANFAANFVIAVKMNGTLYYIPAMAAAW